MSLKSTEVYLDNSATTSLDPRVAERMNAFRERSFANAGSVHQGGQLARVELEMARETIGSYLGAEPRELIFTSGGTEANNYGLKGFAWRVLAETGEMPQIISDRTEHHAILHPLEFLERQGAAVDYVSVGRDGRVTPERLAERLEAIDPERPLLVSVMYANNEVGTINPIAELATLVHERGGLFHTDAVQGLGKLPCTPRELGADMISFSAHKIHGPKGIGLLYVNREVELESLIHGGSQERDRRGGTEPVELVVGFAEAVRIVREEFQEGVAQMKGLNRRLRNGLAEIEGVIPVTPEERALPNLLNITFDDAGELDPEALLVGMDIRGIAVSNGSACTSGSMQPSHVLLALGYPKEQAGCALRFSTGRFTTEKDIDRALVGLKEVLAQMRR